jgi:flagellar hook assembly protein FlgD
MKRLAVYVCFFALCAPTAHAITITAGPTLSGSPVTSETTQLKNGVTIQVTVDVSGQAQVDFFQILPDASLSHVATITQNITGGVSTSIFWNALWPIGLDFARHDGTFVYQVTPIAGGTTGTPLPSTSDPAAQFQITSVDIHNLTVTPSLDTAQQPTFPYTISYALAKAARVTVSILNSSGTVVRTIITSQPQADETISSATVTWDGLRNDGTTVSIGNYTAQVSATDLTTGDPAIVRTRGFAVLSLAGAGSDPQKVFESHTFVFPNPVRNSQGTFQMQAVRDGANLSLKIYTITGTLVRNESFPGIPTGSIVTFNWDGTNQSGNKVGRGLYYYEVREDDSTGTLQTVKKMAVIP